MFALSLFCLTPFLICVCSDCFVFHDECPLHFQLFLFTIFWFLFTKFHIETMELYVFFIICLHFRPTRIVFNRHRPPFYEHNHC